MRVPVRHRPPTTDPGPTGTLRVGRNARSLLPRLRPGDVAVIDQHDLDGRTARALVDSGAVAVLNASPMLSGRYPSLGAEVLAASDLVVLDDLGAAGLVALREGRAARVQGEEVLDADGQVLGTGRRVELDAVREEMSRARQGLGAQLDTFTRNGVEFLRREEDLLLHGVGLPQPATTFAGRSAVVVVRGHDHDGELDAVRAFLREQSPVVVAVGAAADDVVARGHRVQVLVLDGTDEDDLPGAAVLKSATDVVVRTGQERTEVTEALERMGIRPLRVDTSASTEDVALLLAHAGDADLVVGVGMHATLEEFLDSRRPGLASTYLTRLTLGPRLVDAAAVPRLYSGRVRPRHLALVTAAGLLAVLAAIGVTPLGQEWAETLLDQIEGTVR